MSVKVSVHMTAYNHEPFIEQAVESALMQETDFDFEIVIGEDCSPDRTRERLIGLQARCPDRIRLLLHEVNVGARANYEQVLSACRGDYIAVLDGDDYWTDPGKLQKQVDFFEAHPEVSSCGHRVRMVDEEGRWHGELWPPPSAIPETTSLRDILRENYLPACSVMYRRAMFHPEASPWWQEEAPYGDWVIQIMLATRGKLGFIDETMSDYRHHQGGVYTHLTVEKQLLGTLACLEIVLRHLPGELAAAVPEQIVATLHRLAVVSHERGDRARARRYLLRALLRFPMSEWPSFRNLRFLASLTLPGYSTASAMLRKVVGGTRQEAHPDGPPGGPDQRHE